MLNESDIENKSQLELLQQLVDDLIGGDIRQRFLLVPLTKICLLTQENTQVEKIILRIAQYCNEGIKLNNIDAMVITGVMRDLGCPGFDFDKFIECYDEAIKSGNAVAMVARARMHMKVKDNAADEERAIALLEDAIALGYVPAMHVRAFIHMKIQGSAADEAMAIKLFDVVIQSGFPDAMFRRSALYVHGRGCKVDYVRAIELLNESIKLGHTDAMLSRARMHIKGRGGMVDNAEAIVLLNKGIKLGCTDAMVMRAAMYMAVRNSHIDELSAIALFDQAIALGNVEAMVQRAFMHMRVQDSEVDYASVIVLLDKAIKHDHAVAMINRALMHLKGHGGVVDEASAIALLDKAIALGNVEAMSQRALMHMKVQDSEVDYASAIVLLDKGIKHGHAVAMINRALMHLKGHCGVVDEASAIALLDKAIKCDHAEAMYRRALIHLKDQSGVIDYAKAIELLDKAIQHGNSAAMLSRTYMHLKGHGGVIDEVSAIVLLDKAIALGDVGAMYRRAILYLKGITVPVDFVKAIRLHRMALEKDNGIKPLPLEGFSPHDKNIYSYHAAMRQNDTKKAADLLITDFELVTEFIEFDCKHSFIKNPSHLKKIHAVINQCVAMKLDRHKQNELYVLVLIALDDCEKELGHKKLGPVVVNELLQLKKDYLVKVRLDDIKFENLLVIMQLVINAWNGCMNDGWTEVTVNFTKDAAIILSDAMYTLKYLKKETESKDFLKHIATILLKNMYGEKVDVRLSASLSYQQVMLLVAFGGLPTKSPVSLTELNRALGLEGLCFKNGPKRELPAIFLAQPKKRDVREMNPLGELNPARFFPGGLGGHSDLEGERVERAEYKRKGEDDKNSQGSQHKRSRRDSV